MTRGCYAASPLFCGCVLGPGHDAPAVAEDALRCKSGLGLFACHNANLPYWRG
jgi:hypothetical protein